MKNLKIYLLGTLAMFTLACSPELESIYYNEVNPVIFPASDEDVESLVLAAYYPLRGDYTNGIHTTSEQGIMFMLDATTEILQGPHGVQLIQTYHSYNTTSESVTRFYDEFYNDISAMTLNIDLIENASVNENIKKTGIAEIKCARAFLSYELFDMYGAIVVAPLEVLEDPLIETPLARLSHDDTVSFIEQNLLDALDGLPTAADAVYGRFSQGLARMLLIRLYLHEKRWEEVNEQASAIIDMDYYQLEDNYLDLWEVQTPKESKEILFAVPTDYEGPSVNQWQKMVLPANYPEVTGWATMQSSWTFYDSFENNDTRKTNLIAEYIGTDGVTYNRSFPGGNIQLGPIPLKYSIDLDTRANLIDADIILYRYADVLLSKAEAIANKLGVPTQESIDLINEVRERANLEDIELVDYADIDTFNTMILLERSHEYWCENGQYRSDLIRHGKYVEYANALNGSASESEDYKVLFPFSLERISEGKGKFFQNPYYN